MDMKGICFIEPMFHQTITGNKTHTRRIVKAHEERSILMPSPRYNVGEKVYLKEPYKILPEHKNSPFYRFELYDVNELIRHDYPVVENGFWKNKLFMPESAARYFIEFTNVRIEKLQDISEEDCIKEGITYLHRPCHGHTWFFNGLTNERSEQKGYLLAKEAYAALIDSINGKGTWDSNPFVYVYDFKLLDK